MKAAFLAMAVLAAAGAAFYFSTTVNAKASGVDASGQKTLASKSGTMSPAKSISLPLFFEPNQGQTAPQVKFVARGAGYGLFLTSDEAVLKLQHSAVSTQHSTPGSYLAVRSAQPVSNSVIRMKLEGANSAASVSGAEPLPGKSNYFIGNNPAEWRRNIPQFARVEYKSVYPGVDLVYYGDQGQLEYDFRVAPGAEPSQIALSFTGASTRIESGDLILATDQGDVRFHAPRIYQQNGNTQKAIAGSFRQLADNKIGFTIGDYDHSRELVIDPVLNYSTYFGGSGTESLVKVAIDSAGLIYLAGSTDSPDFPPNPANNANNPPIQKTLNGKQNIFIAVINPTVPPAQQLVYWTYLGGTQADSLGGLAVDQNRVIYVAGKTTSFIDNSFPTTANAFQPGPVSGTGPHGFLSVLALNLNSVYALTYSTYLAGNGIDQVTGLAVDASQNAYVTGDTTSSNTASSSVSFPASPNGYQTSSNSSGNPQFFASKINTKGSGALSMLYSTYFGGGNPPPGPGVPPIIANGGGIAVDPSGTFVNMYITGETNMLGVQGPNGEPAFPLLNAQQSCLNEASNHLTCSSNLPTSTTDGFVAKINPNQVGSQSLVYSTYIGAEGNDAGLAIAVDSSSNAYVAGSTASTGWVSPGTGFQTDLCNASPPPQGCSTNGFVVKIGNLTGSVYPITYFTYLGGTVSDEALAIQVDSAQTVHVAGLTNGGLITDNAIQPVQSVSSYDGSVYSGAGDAFVALISTTLSGRGVGDYLTYLGGGGFDQGTGIAFNSFGATYVAGTTESTNFPTLNPYQSTLNGAQNAFVSQIGAFSQLTVAPSSTSPSPSPVAAGTQVAFTFDIGNTGPDTASQVVFTAIVPDSTGLAVAATAKVTTGTGSCGSVEGTTITCFIPTLAVCTPVNNVCSSAAVEVDVTPIITTTAPSISVTGQATANNSGAPKSNTQSVNIVDFTVAASPATTTINAGDTAAIQVAFCPTPTGNGYNAPITPSQTTSPSIVTASTPTFSPATVTPGNICGTTTLRIPTVARPVTTSSVFRRGSFYAAWLPIAGLSLVSLGIGAGRKRRRWLAAVVLGLIAGAILLQSGCGSSSSSVNPGGGTQAGTYIITIAGSAGTGASHTTKATLIVN